MKMLKKTSIFLIIAVFFAAFLLPTVSNAGRLRNARPARAANIGPVDAQLGVRFVSQLPDNLKEGDTMDAIVLNPAKLAAHGFRGLKRGDRLTFIQGREADLFQVQQGNKLRLFKINANGAVTGL